MCRSKSLSATQHPPSPPMAKDTLIYQSKLSNFHLPSMQTTSVTLCPRAAASESELGTRKASLSLDLEERRTRSRVRGRILGTPSFCDLMLHTQAHARILCSDSVPLYAFALARRDKIRNGETNHEFQLRQIYKCNAMFPEPLMLNTSCNHYHLIHVIS